MSRFDRIELHRLRIPLAKPYRLAFGAVEHYDTVLVELIDDTGRTGIGEATVLTGYTDETIEGSWKLAQELAAVVIGQDARDAVGRLHAIGNDSPFTATAFCTAIEMAQGSSWLEVDRTTRVPLLALLHAENASDIEREVDQLLAQGYRTIKVKVGFDVGRDLERVKAAQRAVHGRARLRLDANQGYTAEQGIAFVRGLAPDDIELFEQPCAAGDWHAHLAVAQQAGVPMMLDESIYGVDDIDRAAELGAAAYIKLKLMKLVSLDRLAGAIERIRALNMRPVLGNGVAGDIGCWMEACIAARCIDNAGEMNGFLKPREGILTGALPFEQGAIVLTPGFTPVLDPQRLVRARVDHAQFRRRHMSFARDSA